MRRPTRRLRAWFALAALLEGAFVPVGHAQQHGIGDPSSFLTRTESLRTKDHPRFVRMLEDVHRDATVLTKAQAWYLRYLDAWEDMYDGDYLKSEAGFRDIIANAGDATLAAKASALLLTNLAHTRRYEEAFTLANKVTADLPRITDPLARSMSLIGLSQMFDFADQTDLAIRYARLAQNSVPTGESPCQSLTLEVAAMFNAGRLTPTSPELQHTLGVCIADDQPVSTNAMWLTLGAVYLDRNEPKKVIALLDRIGPSIGVNRYRQHMISATLQRAQAFEKLGDDAAAKAGALATVAMTNPDDLSDWQKEAYELLYRVEKKRGNTTAALNYYERFAAQDKGYLNDVSAKALAYNLAQQHTLAQRLETERLSKQNNILRLQQALDTKAVETSRLYIALLLAVLASIAFWLYRLKRSQMKFRKLAQRDGLTGIFNHQYFIEEADRVLHVLARKHGPACLMIIDLDHFKLVNDTHGHAVGDAVIRHTVTLCRELLRPADLFGRLGGEEFGMLLAGCERDEGMAIAERIREAIDMSPAPGEGEAVSCSASIGLACTSASGYGLQTLCHEADAALYRAKRNGRNRVIYAAGPGNLAVA